MQESIFPTLGEQVLAFLRGVVPVGLCFALLFAVSLLPPDTALREVEERGRLSVCMPEAYPPLVTADADRPGFEVELVQEIAARSGWRLNVVRNRSMGRDFNPRSWRITRAQCQMIAGGVALSQTTKSFMDTSSGHLVTGWMMHSREPLELGVRDQRIGFFAGMTGLDRIELGQFLRRTEAETIIIPSPEALREGLETGTLDVAITEALLASYTFGNGEWTSAWLPDELGRFPLGMGFWRGDTTVRKHVEAIMRDLVAEGFLDELGARYGLEAEVFCHTDGVSC